MKTSPVSAPCMACLLIRWFILALLLLGSPQNAVDATGSVFVPLKLGIDYEATFSDQDLLRGDKLNVEDGENPFKNKVFRADTHPVTFSTSYTESTVVTSSSEVKDSLEISGHLSVPYGPMISGEGAGRYFQDKVQSTNQVSIVYRTRRDAYAKQVLVESIVLSEEAQGLKDPSTIADLYGTKFVDQVVYGAQLDVRYTVSSEQDIDTEEIEVELKGKIGVGPLSISFEAKFEKQTGSSESQYDLSIVAESSGVNVDIPSNPSFDQVNDIINKFNKRYDDMLTALKDREQVDDHTNVLNRLSPVGFTLNSITD